MKIIKNKNNEKEKQLIFHICQKKLLDTVLPNAKAKFFGTENFARSFPFIAP